MLNDNITVLAQKYISGQATEQEIQELHQWYDAWQDDEETINTPEETDTEDIVRLRILTKLKEQIKPNQEEPASIVPIKKYRWYRVVAAAVIFLVISMGMYFIFFNKDGKASIANTGNTAPHDIAAPQKTKATLTLVDGTQVALDSATTGTLAKQSGVNVIKTTDGQIIYNGSSTEMVYNILFNPRGSKVISLSLSDGSKVWLNAESSIKYPVAFTGNERHVEITGEAYFEVAKDAAKKFIVTGNGVNTEVLGTHFNVNTYTDETSVKVTLLEGVVKVTKGEVFGLLKPGQQAQITSAIKVISDADVDAVMAWKNGYFHFGNTNIQDLMKQLARWYDVEIIYETKVPGREFGGEISREANLLQVLKILNESKVKCRLEGNKLIIE